jgi:hypothetical protein
MDAMEGSRLRRAPRPREKAGFTRSIAEARSNLHSRKVVCTLIIMKGRESCNIGVARYHDIICVVTVRDSVPNSICPQ